MTRDEAKFLLQACSDESAPASPEMVEALAMAANDSKLAEFLRREKQFDQALTQKVEEVAVPAELRERLLLHAPRSRESSRHSILPLLRKIFSTDSFRGIGSFAAATAMVIFFAVIIFDPREATADSELPDFFQTVRDHMLADDAPHLAGSEPDQLHQFLSEKDTPHPAPLPDSLSALRHTGASVAQGFGSRKIGVLHLENENGERFRLFIVEVESSSTVIPNYPEMSIREFETIAVLTWQRDGKVHALVTQGPKAKLEVFRIQ